MPNKSAFVSSTSNDLSEYRLAVVEAIRRLGLNPINMENFGSQPGGAVQTSLRELAKAEFFIGIFAFRYGYVPKGDAKSVTEQEYDEAVRRDIPRFIYFAEADSWSKDLYENDETAQEKLSALKDRINKQEVRSFFKTKDQLAGAIATDLGKWLIGNSEQSSQVSLFNTMLLEINREGNILQSKEPFSLLNHRPIYNADCIVGYEAIVQAILANHKAKNFVILGITGSGKTSLLHKIANAISEKPLFWYEFHSGLLSFEDTLLRLGAFLTKNLQGSFDFQHLLLKELSNPLKLDFVISLMQRIDAYIIFDGVEHITEESEELVALFEKMIHQSHNCKIILSSQVTPKFVRERDYSNPRFEKYFLHGLKEKEIREFFSCKDIDLSDEHIELLDTIDGILPITLEFLVPLISSNSSLENLEAALEKSQDKATEELFEYVYAELAENEKKLLSILSAFVLPTSFDLLMDCVALLMEKAVARVGMLDLKKKLLVNETQDNFMFVHDIVRRLTRKFSSYIDAFTIQIADYLAEQEVDSFELAFEIFQMYSKLKEYEKAAQLLINHTNDLIPNHAEIGLNLLNLFEKDVLDDQTWLWLLGAKGDIALHLRQYHDAEQHFGEMIEQAKQINNFEALASALLSQGNVFYEQKKQEAEYFYSQSLKVSQEQDNQYGQARVLNNLALIYLDKSDFQAAEHALKTALELLQKAIMPDWATMSALGNLGNLAYKRGDLETADIYARKVLEIAHNNGYPLEEARSLYNLGLHQVKRGNEDLARDFFSQALKISESYNGWQAQEMILNAIVDLELEAKSYVKAIELLNQNIEILSEVNEKVGITKAKFQIGSIYVLLENFQEAFNFYEQALAGVELLSDEFVDAQLSNIVVYVSLSKNSDGIIEILKQHKNRLYKLKKSFALARIYGALGEIYLNVLQSYRIGVACLEQEIQILSELNIKTMVIERLFDLGSALVHSYERYQKAIEVYTKIIELARDNLAEKINALYSRGAVFAVGEAWEEAKDDFVLILHLIGEAPDFNPPEIEANTRRNLGEVYRNLKQFEEAKVMLIDSIKILQTQGLSEVEVLATEALIDVYQELGDTEIAINLCKKALEICRKNKLSSHTASILIDLGNIYLKDGKALEASQYFRMAFNEAQSIGDTNLEEGSMLSLAYAHFQLGTVHEIEQEFQTVLDRAGELENYDNLIQILNFVGKYNLSELENEILDAVIAFKQAIQVSMLYSYKKAKNQSYINESGMVMHLFSVFRAICEAIEYEIAHDRKDRAIQFYHLLVSTIKEDEETEHLAHYIEPIDKYLTTQPDEHIWDFVTSVWQNLKED